MLWRGSLNGIYLNGLLINGSVPPFIKPTKPGQTMTVAEQRRTMLVAQQNRTMLVQRRSDEDESNPRQDP